MLTPHKFKSTIYFLYYLKCHRLTGGFFIKQTTQVIDLPMLSNVNPTLIDIELNILRTIFTCEQYGLCLTLPEVNA